MSFIGSTDDRLAIHELVMSYGDAVSRKILMIGEIHGQKMLFGVFQIFLD